MCGAERPVAAQHTELFIVIKYAMLYTDIFKGLAKEHLMRLKRLMGLPQVHVFEYLKIGMESG